MLNPARALVKQFLLRTPLTLLTAGAILSLLDFALLYTAAKRDGVLHIDKGIGLLRNYGLLSTVLGNIVFIYLAKKYYDFVCSMRRSKALINDAAIEPSLLKLTSMIRMEGPYRFLIYLFVILGAICWLSNVGFHVLGNPEVRWGHKVFDSPNHRLMFYASRLHNLYTWLIILPLLGHVMVYTSAQLREAMYVATRKRALRYDLLNPDQRGGFLFAEKAHLAFNVVIALVYILITMHIETFARMHLEHIIGYVVITILLIGVNKLFLGNVYSAISDLKLEALNSIKDRVYKDDKLSFEILKYCYERKIDEYSIINGLVKACAILISGIIKLWPLISYVFTRA